MFEPQNQLERSLMKAATEPEHRAQFYRDLIESEILILPVGELPEIHNGAVQTGTKLALQHLEADDRTLLPFFSSLTRVQAIIREEREYLKLGARPFFEMTRGATLVLNPGSDYGKELLPDEVSRLLDGTMFQPRERHVVERDTQILIGQPAKYPTKLVESLQRLYARLPNVRAAYLAQYFDPSRDKAPGLLIAVDASDDLESIISESGICAQGLTPDHDHLDFVQFQQSGLRVHFSQTKPFYKRGVFGRLFAR
jgi:hypothetical protein